MIRVGILGFGSLGKLIYTALSECNQTFLSFIDERSKSTNTISFTYHNIENNQNKSMVSNRCLELKNLDLIILTTKTYQTVPALNSIKTHISPKIPIAIVQNGMGNDELVKNTVANPFFICSTNCGAYRANDKLICTHIGTIVFDANQTVFDIKHFANSLIPWVPVNDIKNKLFGKLAINAVINPITAIHNIKNGEIFAYKELCESIIQEIHIISQKEGCPYSSEELRNLIYTTADQTKFNYSSMHQDLKRGNQTEIDSIIGYLINRAKYHNISVPTLKIIYNQIKIMQTNRR